MTRQEQIQTFVSSLSPLPAGQVSRLHQRGKSILSIADHVCASRPLKQEISKASLQVPISLHLLSAYPQLPLFCRLQRRMLCKLGK